METEPHKLSDLPMPPRDVPQNKRQAKVADILRNRQDLVVVLESLFNPNNIGAIVRTCDSFGVGRIFYIGQTIPHLKQRVSISSTGAEKWVEIKQMDTITDCYEILRQKKYKICTTYDGPKSINIMGADFTKPTAIVMGHEHRGVSKEAFEGADFNVRIPMQGFVRCMNVSVACGIILYEATRQRKLI